MTNIEFGKLIKQLREEQDITQEQLAHRLGYKSKSSINKIELGIQDLPRPKLLKLSEILHPPVSKFVGMDDEPSVRQQLHTLIDNLPDDRIEKILKIIQAIEEQ